MKSDVSIDVRAAIEKNSQVTSVADLERRGKRQVKVIKTSLIYDLIHQAVENVQRTQGGPTFDAEEQRQLVQKSKAEFDRLLGEQQGQKKQLQELQDGIHRYETLVNELNQQIAAHADDLKSEAERARNLDAEKQRYQCKVEELTAQIGTIEKNQNDEAEGLQNLRQKIGGLEEALKVAHQVAEDREKQLGEAEAARKASEEHRLQVASLTAELKAVRENQPKSDELLNELKQMREDYRALEAHSRELEITAARSEAAPSAELLEQILEKKMSQITTELSQKFAGMQQGKTVGTSPEDIKLTIKQVFSEELGREVESNIGDIKVKEKKSGGIAANLERLKNLGLSSEDK